MKKIILLMLVLLTASCNLQPINTVVTIKDKLLIGSTLRLTKNLTIPKDRTFIYIANGKVLPLKDYNTVDGFKPYCMFFLKDETSQSHQVLADTFEVTEVIEWEGYYSSLGFRNAANRLPYSGGFIKTGGDRGSVMYATIMTLRSEKQPEVDKMVCGYWDDYTVIEPLTFNQLESTLGDLITIKINNSKAGKEKFI